MCEGVGSPSRAVFLPAVGTVVFRRARLRFMQQEQQVNTMTFLYSHPVSDAIRERVLAELSSIDQQHARFAA